MIEFINNKAVITPTMVHLFKDVPKKELDELVTYIYYNYIEENYALMLPIERQEAIMGRLCPNLKLDKHKGIIGIVEDMLLTPSKRLAIHLGKRISKIIKTLDESEINVDDLEQEGKNMKGLTEILVIKDKVDALVAKEATASVGRGSKSISKFENKTM